MDAPGAKHGGYERLLAAAKGKSPVRMVVVHPCSAEALEAVVEAREQGLIDPLLVGPRARIEAIAKSCGADIGNVDIVSTEHSHDSAATAVKMIRTGQASALMKGSLHTDELLHAVLDKEAGLRTERRLSHVFVLDVPNYPKPLLITDAVVNVSPTLLDKRDIVQNAIGLAHAIGIARPLVAIVTAVETVNPEIPSTVDAAALCKMAERGQIVGGVLDGPLAFDNAISAEAARIKNIVSPVAGHADILVVPDLEAGNMLVKQLTFLAGADSAGIVIGARVPIVLTSRADNVRNRIASVALGVLLVHERAARAPSA
jgi:phosphotransacetylase